MIVLEVEELDFLTVNLSQEVRAVMFIIFLHTGNSRKGMRHL